MNQIGLFFNMLNKNWHEVNKDDIVFFLGSLLKNGKIKKVSIDNKRRCVKTFFNFLEDNDYIVNCDTRTNRITCDTITTLTIHW